MKKIPYLTQYCNAVSEWRRNGITMDNADENQIEYIKELQSKAVEQSGLSLNELTLISICRKYKIFQKVNIYANRLISF